MSRDKRQLLGIEGNRQWLDGGAMFGNAPKVLWKKWAEPDAENRIELSCRSLLVSSDEGWILFETGIGFYMDPKYIERYGIEKDGHLLLKRMKAAGIGEEAVCAVVLSHLHFDHAGGMIPEWPAIQDKNWQLHFPKARYLVGQRQYEHALNPHPRDRASYIPDLQEKLQASGRLELLGRDTTSTRIGGVDIEFVVSDGHTPGLLHALVQVNGEKIFFCSDLVPGRPFVHLPIVTGYDRWPERSVDEKKLIFERAVRENWVLFYTHDIGISASRITEEKGRYAPGEVFRI